MPAYAGGSARTLGICNPIYHLNMRILPVLALAALLSSCSKASDPAVCAEFDRTIDRNIKRIALTLVQGEIADKGAMQQAARYSMVSSRLQIIATNVDLQAQHNCQIRQSPIDPLVYEEDALKCYSATLRETPEASNLCEFKNWKGTAK